MLWIEQNTQLSTSDKPVLSDLIRPLIVILLMTMGSFTFANSKAPLHHALKYPGGSGPFPTIILLHHAGGYLNTLDQIEHYVGLGYAVALPDYFSPFRLTSQNRFDAFKEKRIDIEKKLTEFVTFLKTQEKVDGENLFAVGLSAGGFFTAFLACDRQVNAGITHYGVWRVPGIKNSFSNFGSKKYPAQYFDNECSPVLALHGKKDDTQKIGDAILAFNYVSKKTTNDFRVHIYDEGEHAWHRGNYGDPNSITSDALRRTHEFIQEFMK
jgi:dienelactone hydrolase